MAIWGENLSAQSRFLLLVTSVTCWKVQEKDGARECELRHTCCTAHTKRELELEYNIISYYIISLGSVVWVIDVHVGIKNAHSRLKSLLASVAWWKFQEKDGARECELRRTCCTAHTKRELELLEYNIMSYHGKRCVFDIVNALEFWHLAHLCCIYCEHHTVLNAPKSAMAKQGIRKKVWFRAQHTACCTARKTLWQYNVKIS